MRTIFWNVDTQYDFMRDDESFTGKLPVPGAREIEPNLERLTTLAAREDVTVVNTADWHTLDDREIQEEPAPPETWWMHCERGTPGAEYVPATAPDNPYLIDHTDRSFDAAALDEHRNIVLYKNEFDVFAGNPHADAVVKELNPARAIVYGVATNVCCDDAVLGLLERGVEVYAVTDAMKGLPAGNGGRNIEDTLALWERRGATLTTTDAVEELYRT